MTMVNIAEAKAKLSEYLEQTASGVDVVICRHNRPVARLVAIEPAVAATTEPRLVGGAVGQFTVPEAFFEPLPPDVESSFYPALGQFDPVARVAEPPSAPPRKSSRRKR